MKGLFNELFEYVGDDLYFRDRSISNCVCEIERFEYQAYFIRVAPTDSGLYVNLVSDTVGLLQLLCDFDLSDATCARLYDLRVEIQYVDADGRILVCDKTAIMRRHLINNIINN